MGRSFMGSIAVLNTSVYNKLLWSASAADGFAPGNRAFLRARQTETRFRANAADDFLEKEVIRR